MTTASAPSILEDWRAVSAAMANAIAIRWSPRASAVPPAGAPDPHTTNPSGRSSALMPSARNPATSTEMRSLSLTRSSPAPLTDTRPPQAASAATAGSSSINAGTSSGEISTSPVRSPSTTIVPRGSSALRPVSRTSTRAPNLRSTSINPVRVGLSPTSSICTRDPGSAAAATIQKAAEEKSPGTESVCPMARCPPSTEIVRAWTTTLRPKILNARSVWSRVAAGSATDVVPGA